jgi:precorrin-2 dehydrogenase / sirohydrochlorin ferrochelatase
MRYFPVQLDIRNRACLVVGGGRVGTRKVLSLIKCGAQVTVVSLQATAELMELAARGSLELALRAYRSTDLQDKFLVIGATDDEALNQKVHADAQAGHVLCNIADRPELCNFILPAVVERGDLVITVSTGGKSPAFAKSVRKELEQAYGPEYALFLELMGAVRRKLLSQAHAPETHKPLFEALIAGGLLEAIKNKNLAGVDALLSKVLGPGFQYAALMQETGS